MKIKFLLALFFVAQLAFGQTEKLIKVSGTKCSLIPPGEFIAASNFSGFQNAETGASIMITELPAPYQTAIDGFTTDILKSKGMQLVNKQTIDFNNGKATFINLTQPANGTIYIKQILIFGDTKGTVIVNGIYPEASKQLEAKIKASLLSTVYNAEQEENPLEAAAFSVDIKDTNFKLVKYISGSLLYSTDGKIPTDKPTLVVGNSIAKVPLSNQKSYSEQRLKRLPRGEFNVIKENNAISIDNLNGYEIIADGKNKENKAELVYQVMLFNDKGDYYIMIGQATEDFAKNLSSFKTIARTFKVK